VNGLRVLYPVEALALNPVPHDGGVAGRHWT